MIFGTGGTTVDPTGLITYLTPNTIGVNSSLYNQTYQKVVDQNAIENQDPVRNKMEIRHISGATYSDIVISCLLDYGEPLEQEAFDNSVDMNGEFVFDELGLKSIGQDGSEGKLLTHVVFHPVQKSLNRLLQIDYGRNVTGYGQIIAENFLSLLENFASTNQPVNPVEGQLWYDSTGGTQTLKIWDNTAWKAASGIQKGVSQPSVETSKLGELWVDTTNQQLRIFTGTRWILVGPVESSVGGLRYGPVIEKIADADNLDRFILTFYIADIPVIVFSKDSFTPKTLITGFDIIKSGINISAPATSGEIANFVGGFLPVLNGTARNAEALSISGVEVQAGKFLRSDVINTTNFEIKIKNNNGISIGADETFKLSATATSSNIYNSSAGSSIDIQTNRNGIPATILRIVDDKIGINQSNPLEVLDIQGNAKITGSFITTNTAASTNLNNGSIITQGGIAVAKNIIVGDGADVTGPLQTNIIVPKTTNTYDIGTVTRRYNNIRAKTIIADTIQGVLEGNISGNANTATALSTTTSFQLAGDVISPAVQFDGQVGSSTKILNATLTANIIAGKDTPTPNIGKKGDFVLTYRPSESTLASSGLLKQTREVFLGDLAVPIGAILPYAGANAPSGYLLCDGAEIERAKFSDLFDIIGNGYIGVDFHLAETTWIMQAPCRL